MADRVVFTAVSEWPARVRSLAVPALAGAFALAVLWQVPGHELWRDEWHPWLVARHSTSLGELLWNKRYDGHPGLWYVLVYALTRVTANPAAIQWLNAAIAIVAGWLLLRHAPFPLLERALCLCGYYFVYEYAVIARNYGLCLLLVIGFCAAQRRAARAAAVVGTLSLALLAWSHALGTILAIVLGVWWLALRPPELRPRGWRRVAAGLFLAAAVAGAAIDAAPPADGGVGGWRFDLEPQRLVHTLGAFSDALLPMPGWRSFGWNSHLLDAAPLAKAAAGLAAAGLAAFVVGGSRRELLLWAASSGGLLAFFYLRYGGTYRHHGLLWVATVAAVWLARDAAAGGRFVKYRRAAFLLLLIAPIPAAAAAVAADARRVFSSSAQAAAVIRDLGAADLPLVGETDVTTAGVAGALDRPIHFPRGERDLGFVLFDRTRRRVPTDAQVVASARRVGARTGGDVVLIMDRPLQRPRPDVRRLAVVPAGMVKSEGFIVYRVFRNPPRRLHERRRGGAAAGAAP